MTERQRHQCECAVTPRHAQCTLPDRAMMLNTKSGLVRSAVVVVLSGCAHRCSTHEPPDSSWAEAVACYHHVELAEGPAADRLGCYRLALGPTYLPNASNAGQTIFIPNPEVIELTSEWYTMKRIHSGLLVRTPAGSRWGNNGVWRPTRNGGALIDLGDGLSGLLVVVHRNGQGYSGNASTYQDIGEDFTRATADLWPVSCARMPPDHGSCSGVRTCRGPGAGTYASRPRRERQAGQYRVQGDVRSSN